MKRRTFADSCCPIARSLDVVGEWWTLLILRDAILYGPSRFDSLQRHLGISPNMLSARLGHLLEEDLLVRRPYSQRPPRDEYIATDKARELLPVLVALAAWGRRWVEGEPEMSVLLHGERFDHPVAAVMTCARCDAPVDSAHLRQDGSSTWPRALTDGVSGTGTEGNQGIA
ncbi:MAG: winged helix-turn-helix transcriptional regulator [Acidimicrobiia bacterium]